MSDDECKEDGCTVSKCDIFDFMAKHVGLNVIHPGGFRATLELSERLRINEESYVIDIACGKGSSAVFLAENYGCKVLGIDIAEDLIDIAKHTARKKGLQNKLDFKTGNAQNLPFPDNTFDIAISQAMLVLVADKIKSIQEAKRVTKNGGRCGWLELTWQKEIDNDFLDKVSNVLCAYCMTNVNTYDGWNKVFKDAGIDDLTIQKGTGVSGNFISMLQDEGIKNSIKIFFNTITNREIRKRISIMDEFFREHAAVFGYGIYVFQKQ